MTTISNLEVVISADIADLQRGMDRAEDLIDSFGKSVKNTLGDFGADLTRFGANLNNLTAPLRNLGISGLDAAADFQDIMVQLETFGGLAGGQLDVVRQKALQLGADTKFSASDAANAMLELVKAGYSTNDAMTAAGSALNLAAVGNMSLESAAGVVSSTLSQFNLNAGDAGTVVDILAQAANASRADVGGLAEGLRNVGVVAATMGFGLDETAAALAVMSNAGIDGADAGTQLKSTLLNLTTSATAKGELDKLGVSLYDTSGNMKDMDTIIDDLSKSMKNFTPEQKTKAIKTLGGAYGITALSALLAADGTDQMMEAMKNAPPAALIAAKAMETFNGKTESLKGSVETLMITALTPLMNNVLGPLVGIVTEAVNAVTDWATANPDLASTLVTIGGALAIAGPLLIGIGTAITLAAPAVGLLAGAFALLVSPIGLAIGVLAGLQALGIIDIPTIFESVKNAIDNLNLDSIDITAVRDKILGLLSGINFNGVPVDLSSIRSAVMEGLGSLNFGGASVDLSSVRNAIVNSFSGMDFSGVRDIINTHFNDILGVIVTVAGLVFGGPIGLTIGIAKLVGSAISSDFLGIGTFLNSSGISGAVQTALNDVKNTINGLISGSFGAGGEAFTLPPGGPLATFGDDLRRGFDAVKGIVENIWNNIKPGFDSLVNGVKGFVDAFKGTETEGLLRVATVITGVLGLLVGKALEIGSDVFGKLLSAVGDTLPKIGEALSSFVTLISRIGQGDFSGAATTLVNGVLSIVEGIGKLNGLNVELPSWDDAMAAWQGAGNDLGVVLDAVTGVIKGKLDDIAVGFRGFVRDIGVIIDDLKSKAAAAQIVLGINVDANSAQVTESTSNIQAADIAKKLEATVNSQLANGEPIKVDVPTLVNVEAMGETDRLVKQIVDPTAIQQAIDAAISSGDVATVQALLPISMKLAVDPAEQMRTLLSTALDAGGENSPVFNVLTQMATELQIDTKEIVAQYDHALKQAAGSQVYTVDVHVKVNPLLDTSGIVPVATAAATNAANSATASGVPQYASGGFTRSEGFAYLHANELILNPQQQMALSRGGAGSGSSVYNMTVIGQSPYEVANMVGRATREQDR